MGSCEFGGSSECLIGLKTASILVSWAKLVFLNRFPKWCCRQELVLCTIII